MESDQISKKDLLDLTGISYGQLYRWKRKGLIPEDWFIRKATFTGQETFFPRDEILSRIEKIKNMKEDLSLEDIAGKFSPLPSEVRMSTNEVIARKISSQKVVEIFTRAHQGQENFAFQDIFALYVMSKLLQSGDLNLEEAECAVKTVQEGYPKFEGRVYDLIVIRKLGVAACALVSPAAPVFFDADSKVIVRTSLSTCLEELKMLM
jgi:DNA-binding transcriptional MerR regulator